MNQRVTPDIGLTSLTCSGTRTRAPEQVRDGADDDGSCMRLPTRPVSGFGNLGLPTLVEGLLKDRSMSSHPRSWCGPIKAHRSWRWGRC